MKSARFPITALWVACAASLCGQSATLKGYFQQLTIANEAAVPAYEQLLAQTDQIAAMRARDLIDALPVIFAVLKSDGPSGIQAAFALTVVAKRTDAAQLLANRLTEIGALLNCTDSRLKATATIVFALMTPPPVTFAVPVLANFISGPSAGMDKAQAVWAMIQIAPGAPETQRAVLYILGLPLDTPTRAAVMNALGNCRGTGCPAP